MRDSMIFYRSFYEAIKELPLDVQAKVYYAIFEYSLNFNEVVLEGLPKTIFTLIKPQLDANNKRFENGKKGGRKKVDNNQTDTKSEPKQNQTETKTEPNNNVNVNDNVNDNDNDNEDISNDISNKIYILSKDSIYESEQRKEYDKIEKDKKSIYDFIQKNKPKIIEPYKDIWNVFAKEYNFPEVKSISAARKRKFKARIKDKEFDFLQVLVKAKDSEFLSSSTFFTWDWIFENDKNYLKILEGNYKNKFFKNKETIKANIL